MLYTQEIRKKEQCPACTGSSRIKMIIRGGQETYVFDCNICFINFEYSYNNSVSNYRKELKIHAVCPSCGDKHKATIVGKPDTDKIPCISCWEFFTSNFEDIWD